METPMKVGTKILAFVLLSAIALGGCASRVRLDMGGLTEGSAEAVGANAARMNCTLRRGLGRVALRCPGIVHPENTVDMVVWMGGRVECVARRDHEDDCPIVAEALLTSR